MFKRKLVMLLLVLLLAVGAGEAQTAAQERAARLHDQLAEQQSKQIELQSRLDILNEQLKPENIEKSLAGVGSTRPEDLRELRRRQLETEKAGIENQLTILNDSRAKLEASIGQADAVVYQQSARPATTGEKVGDSNGVSSRPRQVSRKRVRARRANR
jgi:uncharacterized coiled-coil protein SlyX